MTGELVSIPIQGGIDQSVAIALGEPRVWRLERARFVQPGEVVASPGYAYDPHSLGLNSTQHLVALGYSNIAGNWGVVEGNVNFETYGSTWSTYLVRRDPIHGWLTRDNLSPAQAPRRHTVLTNALFTSAPQILKTTDPSMVIVVSNSTFLSYWKNGKILKEKILTYSPPGTPDDTTKFYAAGYCLIGSHGGVYSYNTSTDTFTRIQSYTPYVTQSVWSDPNFGLPGSGNQYCAVVDVNGNINVYQWDGSSSTMLGTVPSTDLPNVSPVGVLPGLVSICFAGSLMIRFAQSAPAASGGMLSLYFNSYGLPGVVKQHVSDSILNSACGGLVQTILDAAGWIWVAIPVVEIAGILTTTLWILDPETPTLTLQGSIPGRTLTGRLTPAPGETLTTASKGVLVQTQYGPSNDPASELWAVNTSSPQLLTTLHGYNFVWGASDAPPSPNAFVAMRSNLDHQETCALVMAGQSQVSFTNLPNAGNGDVRWANELVSIELGALQAHPVTVPGLGSLSPGYQHSPIEAYQQAGDLVSGGLPVSLGNRVDFAGCLFVPPAPTATVASGAGLADGTYLYTLILEVQDSEGRVIRGAPSAPLSVTTDSPNNKVTVQILGDLPKVPGVDTTTGSWVLYRTTSNGTLFHRVWVFSGVDPVTHIDTTSDSSLITASILYTQGGNGGISGQTPSYGVPPCRCIWRGRDRVIVGGLELPRRVRWSKLFFPGEGVSFAHPSLAQWYLDVDDDVTAVAQLDDAWIVFCRTSIFAIYGIGPDDTGANGTFDPPRCVSRSYGCHSPRSLLELPEGILFQGQDGGMYLLTRGNLQVVWWSEKVRDLFGDVGTGLPMGWITSVVAHESKNTIHFIRDTQPPVVFDKRIQAWSLDTDWVSPGLTGAVTATVGRMPASVQTLQNATDEDFTLFIGTADGHLIYEACNNGVTITTGPDGTLPWNPLLETSDISLFGLMGWGGTPRISLMFGAGTSEIPSTTPIKLTIFNDKDRGDNLPDAVSVPHEFTDSSQYITSEIAPRICKCSSLRLRVEWTRESFVGFSIEVDQKPRTERTTSTVRA